MSFLHLDLELNVSGERFSSPAVRSMWCQVMVAEIGTEGELVLARCLLTGISNVIILYWNKWSTPCLSSCFPDFEIPCCVLAAHPNSVNHRAETEFLVQEYFSLECEGGQEKNGDSGRAGLTYREAGHLL